MCHNLCFSYSNTLLEQEILLNFQLGVICTDMVDFRRPGHILSTSFSSRQLIHVFMVKFGGSCHDNTQGQSANLSMSPIV